MRPKSPASAPSHYRKESIGEELATRNCSNNRRFRNNIRLRIARHLSLNKQAHRRPAHNTITIVAEAAELTTKEVTLETGRTDLPSKRVEGGKDSAFPPLPNTTNVEVGLTTAQVQQSLEFYGPNGIPVPDTPLYKIFLRQFVGLLPFLIEVAAIVSLGGQNPLVDFGIIAGILLINGLVGFREEYHAKKSLDEISNSLESEVAVRRNSETTTLPTSQLVPGDIILMVGETIGPADVKWLSGDKMSIDTAALAGEPIPRKYPSDEHGDIILSGTTVIAGECYAQVMKTGTNTEIGQAQANVLKDKSVWVVSVFQTEIMTVVQLLISGSLAVVLAVLLVEGVAYNGFKTDMQATILDALSILIAAIPVALTLVLQINLALGASFLAKEHHTSIPALQAIASMSMLCSDKTGTLTTAKMSIMVESIIPATGYTASDVLRYAYLCSNADKKDDPIDRSIAKAFLDTKQDTSGYTQTEIIGFNPNVKRVVAFVTNGDQVLTIAKGLPAKVLNTAAGGEDNHE